MTKNKIQAGRTGFCTDTIELKERAEIEFLELGRRLCEISRGRLWRGGWDSWEEYLHELRMSQGTASKLMRIYQLLVERHGFSPANIASAGGWTVVAEVLPAMKEKHEAERWMDLARRLSRTDLRRTFHEETKETNMLTCRHTDTYLLRICNECGLKMKVFEDELQADQEKNYGGETTGVLDGSEVETEKEADFA